MPEKSPIIDEVLNSFVKKLEKEKKIETHIVTALKTHFEEKQVITAAEVKAILSTPAEVK